MCDLTSTQAKLDRSLSTISDLEEQVSSLTTRLNNLTFDYYTLAGEMSKSQSQINNLIEKITSLSASDEMEKITHMNMQLDALLERMTRERRKTLKQLEIVGSMMDIDQKVKICVFMVNRNLLKKGLRCRLKGGSVRILSCLELMKEGKKRLQTK